jgi:hypothetical protein
MSGFLEVESVPGANGDGWGWNLTPSLAPASNSREGTVDWPAKGTDPLYGQGKALIVAPLCCLQQGEVTPIKAMVCEGRVGVVYLQSTKGLYLILHL